MSNSELELYNDRELVGNSTVTDQDSNPDYIDMAEAIQENQQARVEGLLKRKQRLANESELMRTNRLLDIAEVKMQTLEQQAENDRLDAENKETEKKIEQNKIALNRLKKFKLVD